MKKILSFVLVLALAATLSVAVFAATDDASDTVDTVEDTADTVDTVDTEDTEVVSDTADTDADTSAETDSAEETPKTGDSLVAVVIAAVAACGIAVAAKKFSK